MTRADPEPKDARTAGAQAVARLLPNRLRTAGVSTTTAELVGTSEADPSTSSSREGNPRALSAAHIAGSQETLASRLTCWATQAAAAARAAAAWRAAAALVGLPAGGAAEVPDRRDRQHPDDQDDDHEPGRPPASGRPGWPAGRAEPAGSGPAREGCHRMRT